MFIQRSRRSGFSKKVSATVFAGTTCGGLIMKLCGIRLCGDLKCFLGS